MSTHHSSTVLESGTILGQLDEFADGQCHEWLRQAELNNEPVRILIHKQGDQVRGFVNRCPHFQLPLSNEGRFMMWDDEEVMCIHHSAVFRLQDGLCTDGPCLGAYLEAVPLQVIDERIVAI